MASTDARPIPRKNVAFRVTFCILDADGDLVTGAAGLDSEVSKDGETFANCTNEATEIATSSGCYFLDLTNTEMNADTVVVIVKTSTSDAKTQPIVLYPDELGDVRVNVEQYGGTNGTFSSGRPEVNATHWGGTAAASANVLIDGAITAAKIASDAITAAKVADGFLTAAKFASGAFDAAWSVAVRLLTAGTNIALAKGTGVTGFNDLDAASVRTAMGMASANLDTQLSAGFINIYHADIQFCRDQTNTQDEYTVTFFKNGVRQTSEITSPTIQVIKRVDGTNLVAATAMTQIGSVGSYKYDATGVARQTQGEAVLVVVAWTQDSGSRSFSRLSGRDST